MTVRKIPTLDSGNLIFDKFMPARLASGAVAPLVASLVPDANMPTRLGATALSATFGQVAVPRWVTATNYTAGDLVVSPTGDIVSSVATHLSGASFTPANWNSSAGLSTKQDVSGVAQLARFHAGLTGITTRPVNCMAFGDSITEGAGVSAPSQRYVDLLRDAIRTKHNPLGMAGGFGIIPAKPVYPATLPYVWTYGGSVATSWDPRTVTGSFANLVTPGQTMSLTFTGTGITLFYTKFNATPPFTITIDGGAVALPSFAGQVGYGWGASQTYSGLTSGSHTIVITRTTGDANPYYFQGALILDGDLTSGQRQITNAVSGSTTNTAAEVALQAAALNPDLVTIYFGTNEYRTNVTPATFKTNMLALVQRCLDNGRPRPPVVVIQGYQPTHPGTPSNPWSAFRTAMAEVAAEKGVLIADLVPYFGTGIPSAAYLADGIHPNTVGHALVRDALLAALRL